MMGWEKQRLEDCFKLRSGDGLTSKMMSENGNFPVFGGNGIAGLHNNYNLSGSNVIIGRVGALCGNVRHMNKNIWLTDNAFKLTEFKFDFDHSFLTYLLNYKNLREYARQSAQPVISNSSLKDVILEFPKSLPEQKRIVSILDKAFAAIAKAKANAEQNLKNAKELFESYLQGVFENKGDDWDAKTLKEVCAKITDGTHQTPKYFDEGIIFLSSKNVTTGKINWDSVKYIDEKQHSEMHKRVAPKIGDILLAKNGTTGVAAMVDRDILFDIYVSLAHIRVLDKVLPEFMLYFINSPVAKKQFNKRLKGSGVPNLHLEEIREVVISFPKSKVAQQIIVRQLDVLRTETQKLEAVYQKKIKYLEELKKSILQKAFAGELNIKEAVMA